MARASWWRRSLTLARQPAGACTRVRAFALALHAAQPAGPRLGPPRRGSPGALRTPSAQGRCRARAARRSWPTKRRTRSRSRDRRESVCDERGRDVRAGVNVQGPERGSSPSRGAEGEGGADVCGSRRAVAPHRSVSAALASAGHGRWLIHRRRSTGWSAINMKLRLGAPQYRRRPAVRSARGAALRWYSVALDRQLGGRARPTEQ